MKVTRRKMLTAMGVAASSAALGQIHKGDKDALEVSRPLTAKLNGANSSPVCLADFEPLAKERLSHFAYEYIASGAAEDRKSTRLNSSHDQISYAVFCL